MPCIPNSSAISKPGNPTCTLDCCTQKTSFSTQPYCCGADNQRDFIDWTPFDMQIFTFDPNTEITTPLIIYNSQQTALYKIDGRTMDLNYTIQFGVSGPTGATGVPGDYVFKIPAGYQIYKDMNNISVFGSGIFSNASSSAVDSGIVNKFDATSLYVFDMTAQTVLNTTTNPTLTGKGWAFYAQIPLQ